MTEKQAGWRERNLKNENGTKLRAQFIFDASTRAQLKIARSGRRKNFPLISPVPRTCSKPFQARFWSIARCRVDEEVTPSSPTDPDAPDSSIRFLVCEIRFPQV
jgi:hypothetical protein